jgi:hypothetical protein
VAAHHLDVVDQEEDEAKDGQHEPGRPRQYPGAERPGHGGERVGDRRLEGVEALAIHLVPHLLGRSDDPVALEVPVIALDQRHRQRPGHAEPAEQAGGPEFAARQEAEDGDDDRDIHDHLQDVAQRLEHFSAFLVTGTVINPATMQEKRLIFRQR